MQQYLTLEEAAKYLQMSIDDLREMAKNKSIRAFQDRGTWRFRQQDIEELARSRGVASDVDLQLGEATVSPTDSKRTRRKPSDSDALPADFSFDDDEVPIGREKLTGSGKSGVRSPKPGSDSDVRLVMDGDDDSPRSGKSGVGKRGKPSSDSGVRLIPSDETSDSDVRLEESESDSASRKRGSKSPSDSDIRLHEAEDPKKRDDFGQVTEEIDLDAEEAKHSAQPKKKSGKPSPASGKTQLPGTSPFELSEDEIDVSPPKSSGSKKQQVDSSSDFELIPFDSTKSPIELGSGQTPLLQGDEEVNLGSEVAGPYAGSSGINLTDPADSGISLEDGGSDEIEFELSLDEVNATPKPTARSASRPAPKGKAPKPPAEEEDSSSEFELSLEDSSPMDNSSSEFELSLDDDSPTADSSSEFELSLDDSGVGSSDDESASDSEFELTLDDDGGLGVEEGGDIFEETNFDVPALDDESGSEAVALDESDTDLEGSDFEISLDDDSSAGEESGSQVVALEDEDADDAAATVARPRKSTAKGKAALKDDDLDLDLEETPRKKAKVRDEDDFDDELDDEGRSAAVASQDWGALPAVVLFPTVLVMFLVSIMGFELLRGMFGYHRPTTVGKPVIDMIARQIDDGLPK